MTSVAGVVVEALARSGVERLFVAGARGALAAAEARGLTLVHVGGDTAACVMAAVTGDASDAPGAVAVGDAASAEPALAAALAERSPLVCLGAGTIGERAVKAVLDGSTISASHRIAHALQLAMAPPRGPVWLGAGERWEGATVPAATAMRRAPLAPDADALDRVAAVIRQASRPVVLAGVDARDAASGAWLRAFAESLPAPVLATWKAKGALADPHPLAFGVAGTSAVGTTVLHRADLIVALGLDATEWAELAPRVPVVDAGPGADSGRPVPPAVSIHGDVGAILAELGARLTGDGADWDVAQLDRWKRQLDLRGTTRDVRAVAMAREAMPAGTSAAFEWRLLSAATAWDCVSPSDLHVPARSRLDGFAVPAAIAAALARPAAVALAFTDAPGLIAARGVLPIAVRHGVTVGVVVTGDAGPQDACADVNGVGFVRAATDAVFGVALSRLLAERRSLIIELST